jgi:hypothetical protein
VAFGTLVADTRGNSVSFVAMPLISDPIVLTDLAAEWNGVVMLRGKIQRATLFAFASGAPVSMVADAAYNLPMLHAFGVLNNALEAIRDEGRFACSGRLLGKLLDASKAAIPWLDFSATKAAVDRRNDVAHRGELLPRAECWRYIDLIEAQLVAWGVIPAP